MKTFPEIHEHLKSFTSFPFEDAKKALILIAEGELGPIEEDELLRFVQRKSEFKLRILRKEYEIIRRRLNLVPTDVALAAARDFMENKLFGGRHIQKAPDNSLFLFTGKHWKSTTLAQLRTLIQPIALKYRPMAANKGLNALVGEALSCLLDMIEPTDETDVPQPIINTQNCEIWLKSDGSYESKLHNPESVLFNVLPYSFDSQAKCPLFDQTLSEVFANATDIEGIVRHFNEMVGYAIQPTRPVDTVWFLIGGGENGKSTLVRVIEHLIGLDAVFSTDINKFREDKFNLFGLRGKLILKDDDIKHNTVIDEALLKKLSGNGLITGRGAYKKMASTSMNTAMPILIGNDYPLCNDYTHGWTRRVQVFPFDRQFKKAEIDPDRFDRIVATEMPGILNRALEGYARFVKRGKFFDPPKDCLEAVQEFQKLSNPVREYLSERVIEDLNGHVRLKDMRVDMEIWSKENGRKFHVPGKVLKRTLEGMGLATGILDGGYSSLIRHRLKDPTVAI